MKRTSKKSRKRRPAKSREVARGSRNVFADLGVSASEAAELKVKADLTFQIYSRIKKLGLTQVKAAQQLGLGQPDISKLMNGRYIGYSVERLLSLLSALEVDIDIIVRPKHHNRKTHPGVVPVMHAAAT